MQRIALAAAAVLAVAGCAASQGTPIDTADQVTRAVYTDDLNGTVMHFDDGLRAQVKTQDVDQLSQTMHGLGNYQKLSTVNTDPLNRRYDYQASFEKGQMLVQLRFDPDGRVAAYRVTPVQQ
jgi:hypothetical protein